MNADLDLPERAMGCAASVVASKVILVYVGEDGDGQQVVLPKNYSRMLVSELKVVVVAALGIECSPSDTSLVVLYPDTNARFQTNRNLSLTDCGIRGGARVVLTLRPTPPSTPGQSWRYRRILSVCL